jgi:hypothetical protein
MSGLTGHGLRFDKKRLQRIPDKYIARKPSAAGIEYRYWNMPRNLMRDQGNTSSCVEHGFFHQALCGPKRVIPTFKQFSLYKRALQLDPFSGEDFEGGTTVEAGALAAREFGLLKEFHWTDSPDVAIAWLLAKGGRIHSASRTTRQALWTSWADPLVGTISVTAGSRQASTKRQVLLREPIAGGRIGGWMGSSRCG